MRRYFILVFLLVFLVPASAQTFHTKLLQSIAERLNLTEQLRDTTLTQVTTSEGRMLNVRFDGGQVQISATSAIWKVSSMWSRGYVTQKR